MWGDKILKILGINGINDIFHDASATLIVDNKIIASVEEERFNRKKHSNGIPFNAINFCLNRSGLSFEDLDHVGYYLDPVVLKKTFVDDIVQKFNCPQDGLEYYSQVAKNISNLRRILESHYSFNPNTTLHFLNHHLVHASSAYYISGFNSSAILTIDGSGDRETCTLYSGNEQNITKISDFLVYPYSLGFIYTIFSDHLGLGWIEGPGKLMGLAGYGEPDLSQFEDIIYLSDDPGQPITIDLSFFNYHTGGSGFSSKGLSRFGQPRKSDQPLEKKHYDLAASVQLMLEKAIVHIVKKIPELLPETKNLCLAGGVCLNVCTNRRIVDSQLFEHVFITPPAYDGGTSLGCALYLNTQYTGFRNYAFDVYAGPDISKDFDIKSALLKYPDQINWELLSEPQLFDTASDYLVKNKIIGWVQGRMEMGPRALGNRSILTNAMNENAKDLLNTRVKKREAFRPYAPSILKEESINWFNIAESPFMLLEAKVPTDIASRVPGIVHVDGTTRPQTVSREKNFKYYMLINAFYRKTGVPLVLNTSFNLHGEPVVNRPEEAINDFLLTDMDALFIDNYYITKKNLIEKMIIKLKNTPRKNVGTDVKG